MNDDEATQRYRLKLKYPHKVVLRRFYLDLLGFLTVLFLITTIGLSSVFVLAMTTNVFKTIESCSTTTAQTATTTAVSTTTSTTTTTGTTTTSTTTTTVAAGLYVTDLYIVVGASASVSCPTGYTKLSQTLGTSSGGYYYLCYSKSGATPITAITVYAEEYLQTPDIVWQSSPWHVVNNSMTTTFPGFNLNTNAPFSTNGFQNYYVYMYYSKSTTEGQAIQNIQLLASYSFISSAPTGWNINFDDLNHGPLGEYVFLLWQ